MTTTGVDESPDRSQGTYEEEAFQADIDQPVATHFRTPRVYFPRPDPVTQGLACPSVASSTPGFAYTRAAS